MSPTLYFGSIASSLNDAVRSFSPELGVAFAPLCPPRRVSARPGQLFIAPTMRYRQAMPTTLLLDVAAWDATIAATGNIALATEPYSIVQDVASACRLFSGELWYDTAQGVRYFDQALGQYQPVAVLKDQLTKAALSVPGVLSATVLLDAMEGRALTGQVQIETAAGTQVIAI